MQPYYLTVFLKKKTCLIDHVIDDLKVVPYLSEAEEKADPSNDAQHLPNVLLDLRCTRVTCGMSETRLQEEQTESECHL